MSIIPQIFIRSIFSLAFIFCISCITLVSSVSAALFEMSAFDSIAGYGTEIKISNGEERERVKVVIMSPAGEVTTEYVVLDAEGESSFIVPGENTQKSGEYTFVVVEEDQFYADGREYSFEIFPDDPISSTSQLYAIESSARTGKDVKVTALLYDKYFNPIEGHRVTLSSSRSTDSIEPLSIEKTNSEGEVSFFVRSQKAGESIFTAVNETMRAPFLDTADIRFYTDLSSSSLSADLTSSASAASLFGDVSRFEIDFPSTVTADSDANYLTIRVLDSDGNVVKDFVGSVLITIPTEDNAVVPGDEGVYTFVEKDQGEILFSRSVVFPEKGSHRLEIYAYDTATQEVNYNIFAKQNIIVEEKETGTDPTDSEITVSSPSDNSSFSSPSISVSGMALANSDVKIVLDGNPVLEAKVGAKGTFTAVLNNVSEGDHSLYVYQKETPSKVSRDISFTVDTKASGISDASFVPEQAAPEESVEVTVKVDDASDVAKVEVFWDGKSAVLKQVGSGSYQGVITAPESEGDYSIKVVVTDLLQNTVQKTLESELSVSKGISEVGDVSRLNAEYKVADDAVILSWDSVGPSPLLYIVESGISASSLNKVKSVSGKTTSAALDGLAPGTYFFAITPVNLDGTEGDQSRIIEFDLIVPTPTPTPTPEPTTDPTIVPTPVVTATPSPTKVATPTPVPYTASLDSRSENSLYVSWNAYPAAGAYKISYGIQPRSYNASLTLESTPNSFTLNDLIDGLPYYVQVEALGINGNTLFSYPEVFAIPQASSFHPAAVTEPLPYPVWVTQTGPQLFLFIGGLFLFCSAWYLTRREDVLV